MNLEQERLKGTVKFYKETDGFGFIACGNEDFYFRIRSVKGEKVPHSGDLCEFTIDNHAAKGKNRNAKDIVISKSASSVNPNDSRVKCPSCGKLVVPRVCFYYGSPDKSFCPYCGAKIKNFGNFWKILRMISLIIAVFIFLFIASRFFLFIASRCFR